MIHRFSSRRCRLDHSFLAERLRGAQRYDRIAGFFSSSILEVAGEELESVAGPVRLVCNSGLDPRDVEIAKKAAQAAMRRNGARRRRNSFPNRSNPASGASTNSSPAASSRSRSFPTRNSA